MKKTLIIALLAIHVHCAYSQTSIFSRPATFSKSLQSVLEDYPNNFHNIGGEAIIEQGEAEQYISTVQLPGAEACIIEFIGKSRREDQAMPFVVIEPQPR